MIRLLKENATELLIGMIFGSALLIICWYLPGLFHWLREVVQ